MRSNLNPIALTKTKIAYNFGLSECYRVCAILVFLSAIGLTIAPRKTKIAHNFGLLGAIGFVQFWSF